MNSPSKQDKKARSEGSRTQGAQRKTTHLVDALALDGAAVALALEGEGGDKALDLGALGVLLAVLLLGGAKDLHVLAHVILLGQVEELADLGRPLGAPVLWLLLICQPWDLALACGN